MFVWSNKFETKIDLVDRQHKTLFDLMNKLSNLLKSGSSSQNELSGALSLLIHYTKTHLHDEELLMQDSRIDGRFFSRHRMEHSSFLYDVDRFNEITSPDDDANTDRIEKIVRFIAFWLIYHILGTDQFMAEQIALIKSGMSPERAFETTKEQKLDPIIVKMMLDAVMNLWIDAKNTCSKLETKCSKLETKCRELENKCKGLEDKGKELEHKIQSVLVETIDVDSDFKSFEMFK